ncbi:hypothetical protein N9N67_07110 [Bacteriovoracaceae bacterium]|nr:hypothetical protein [Bacteriovoracaceae bacterium]
MKDKLVLMSGLSLVMTFFFAGISKIFSLKAPDWFISQFESTFLNVFEGSLHIQFLSIGIIELAAAGFIIFGVITNSTKMLKVGLYNSQLNFLLLSFGSRVSHQYENSLMLLVLVLLCVPLIDRVERFQLKNIAEAIPN